MLAYMIQWFSANSLALNIKDKHNEIHYKLLPK
jgi:hypothetical protein